LSIAFTTSVLQKKLHKRGRRRFRWARKLGAMTPARAAQARNISIAAESRKLCILLVASEMIACYKKEEIHEEIVRS